MGMTNGGGWGTGEQFDKEVNAADTCMVDDPIFRTKWAYMIKVVKVTMSIEKKGRLSELWNYLNLHHPE